MAVVDAVRRAFGADGAPELSDDRQKFIRWCADLGTPRINGYRLFEEYYDGQQRAVLTDRMRLYLEGSGLKFTENVCQVVVDKLAGRLHVEGFQVADRPDVSEWLSKTVWSANGADELQGTVHTNTAMLGDAFVIVAWNNQTGLPTYRYNRPGVIKMEYDEDGEAVFAVKKWASSKQGPQNPAGSLIFRLNLYYPDRVEKWFSIDKDGEHWAPWRDTADEAWPVPWTISGELPTDGSPAEDPLGIAVVHFRNKPLGRPYGRSELLTAIPFQDEHTKNILDQFSVMDAQGWAWPWITGVTTEDHVTLGVGDILKLTSSDAKVGQLPAADPSKILPVTKGTLQRLSAFTDTPLFDLIIEGTPPTGEALKTAEGGLTKKTTNRQPSLGNSWKRVNQLAMRLAVAHGDLPFEIDPDVDVVTVWDSPETRDEQGEAMTALSYADLGVSQETLLRRLGFNPAEEAELRAKERPPVEPPPAP